jgi:hypothetical protein
MIEALAILFMAAGIALAVWWAFTDQPQKPAGFAAAGLAVVAGAVLLLRTQIAELSTPDLATIDAAAARATSDADAIRELREKIEADAKGTSSRAAAHAAEARRLAAQTSEALARVERRVSALNEQIARREPARAPRERVGPAASPSAGSPSMQQLAVVATALRSTGSHEVTLTTSMDDREAISLAIRLKEAIEAGGWTVHLNQAELSPPVFGVQVLAPVPLSPHVTTLLGALGRAGLQPKGLASQDADKLEVLVGPKPRES